MNAERLLRHYNRIADAPDAIARLRRFVLELAVRGKLVPQDPYDEPASELLKRIAQEKARQVKGGDFKVQEAGAPILDNQQFEFPDEWAWTRVGSVAYVEMGQSPPSEYYNQHGEGIPFFQGKADFGKINPTPRYWCTQPTKFAEPGDILISVRAPVGPTNMADQRCCIGRGLTAIRPYRGFDRSFLRLCLTTFEYKLAALGFGTTFEAINKKQLTSFPLPLPPYPEQLRIVAKVDELMALCDRLEAARAEREATRDRVTAASLARINAPDLASFATDTRFALDALPALTARPDQVEQLRQTILNLAVRGKLVPQEPRDEPVGLRSGAFDDKPREFPASWRYVRLVSLLAEDTRNGYSRKPDDAPNGTPILRISAGTVRGDGIVAEEEHKFISGIDRSTRLQYGLKPGDLLACRFNGNKSFVGRLTRFEDYLAIQPIFPDKLIRVRVAPELTLPSFVQLAGNTDIVRNEVEAVCATTVGNWGISATKLKEIRFPLPPLAEQHRIVAKVDALMALCDRLEASLDAAAATRGRLLDALLAEALAPAAAREMEAAE